MDMDTTINGLAHDLWASAQGRAAIEDVVTPMMAELHAFAAAVQAAERERCAAVCKAYAMRHAADDDNTKAQAWMILQCSAEILKA